MFHEVPNVSYSLRLADISAGLIYQSMLLMQSDETALKQTGAHRSRRPPGRTEKLTRMLGRAVVQFWLLPNSAQPAPASRGSRQAAAVLPRQRLHL
jgi:hypothetical protein